MISCLFRLIRYLILYPPILSICCCGWTNVWGGVVGLLAVCSHWPHSHTHTRTHSLYTPRSSIMMMRTTQLLKTAARQVQVQNQGRSFATKALIWNGEWASIWPTTTHYHYTAACHYTASYHCCLSLPTTLLPITAAYHYPLPLCCLPLLPATTTVLLLPLLPMLPITAACHCLHLPLYLITYVLLIITFIVLFRVIFHVLIIGICIYLCCVQILWIWLVS
jgi:hypothetical protein